MTSSFIANGKQKDLWTVNFKPASILFKQKHHQVYDLGDYLKFLNTVKKFFTGTVEQQPDELLEAFRIKSLIYNKASKFRISPTLDLNYVYTGSGVIEDRTFKTQVNSAVDTIKAIPYHFSKVSNTLIGADALAERYKDTLNRNTKHLCFQRYAAVAEDNLGKAT